MKKYEYVKLDIDSWFGAGSLKHRKIINEYAQKGYRYIGYIPIDINEEGKIKEIDLIFEIEL